MDAALDTCVDAHTCRYGPVSTAMLARLLDAHERNALVQAAVARAEEELRGRGGRGGGR